MKIHRDRMIAGPPRTPRCVFWKIGVNLDTNDPTGSHPSTNCSRARNLYGKWQNSCNQLLDTMRKPISAFLVGGWTNPIWKICSSKWKSFPRANRGGKMKHIWSRFAVRYHPPPPTWYGPKTCVLQHSAWKRCICSVFCMVDCWCGPQPCKFVGFLQPTFRKRVICNVSASTSWSSAAAPSSISVSNYHIILNLLLRVFSLGTGLISVYILCLSNFLLECLVFRNWSNLKFS